MLTELPSLKVYLFPLNCHVLQYKSNRSIMELLPFQGRQLCQNCFASLLRGWGWWWWAGGGGGGGGGGYRLEGKNLLPEGGLFSPLWGQFFSFRVDLFSEGVECAERQTKSKELCPLE